ncbi:hypothetical protein B7755_008655 [Streptomyces sp. NBS 14/10]|uniref:hypothetical protein n=1 Tax=Streptomyces sp. NBS 14/10 TaxID=1945643 RepID=UPI000D1A1196|nr:hypothetical protein [Streptomyces sp. NBS 14/10]KAK1178202.1 hypothetical protein B7755_008655 [Streptomyces sp. NBS 14/10]NUP44129.1 hypothetical protein [Streptomyces sp.]NUS89789.1 hypothetical protein [Streptomyces sp.]
MLVERQRQDGLTLHAELLEGLMARPEAPVSGAPLHTPAMTSLVMMVLSAKEPKEPRTPKEPRRR